MKKRLSIILAGAMLLSLCACGKETSASESAPSFEISENPIVVTTDDNKTSESVSEVKQEEEKPEEIPENSYRSELTNEWISNDIKNQRPIAVMIDNESIALPHYGTSDADIVYEMMNSTANGRITRLMCLYKDWKNVKRIGNIRSTRSTNCFLFPEYNAILVHDGGPGYINMWFNKSDYPNSDHISGGFARIDRGKAGTYEEYVTIEDYKGEGEYAGKTYDGLITRIAKAKCGEEYNKYYQGPHFLFSDTTITLDDGKTAEKIEFPYDHNSSTLTYNKTTKTYDYSEYHQEYVDAAYDDGRGLSFKNVIIQIADFAEFDSHGYFCFYGIGSGEGYFCTEGKYIPVKWEKTHQTNPTKFWRKDTGEEIVLNTGKTYITICPSDVSSKIVFE